MTEIISTATYNKDGMYDRNCPTCNKLYETEDDYYDDKSFYYCCDECYDNRPPQSTTISRVAEQTKMSQTVNVPAPKYTVANVGKYIKHDPASDDDYESFRTDDGRVTTQFIWSSDDKLHKIASDEYRYHIGDKRKNLMWVEELKRIADWKEGEYIYAFLRSNGGMYFSVHYKKDKIQFDWFNLIVEPSGYVCMEAMNLYTLDSDEDIRAGRNYIRVESVYNDKICKTLNKKKAKAKATAKK